MSIFLWSAQPVPGLNCRSRQKTAPWTAILAKWRKSVATLPPDSTVFSSATMIDKFHRYPRFTAFVAQTVVSPFLVFDHGIAGMIAPLTVMVFSQLWAMEVSENKTRKSRRLNDDDRCTWIKVPRLSNGQSPTVMSISVHVHGDDLEDKNDPPVLMSGSVIGDAGFVAYVENVFRSHKQILE
ncbi:hypothetical protein [Ferrovum sp.]|uniref:hypothetical protein n=2 Tax=Ferrovum sp. TaxID=2609467 RepID=UPI0026202311|nr:hypothetical protein [Ferrovum sp.]